MITLEGLGLIKKWRFPQDHTKCPVNKCCSSFKSRSAAIAHYKEIHAKKATLCPVCNKVIANSSYNLEKHMGRMHPGNLKTEPTLNEVEKAQNISKPGPRSAIGKKPCKYCAKSFINLQRHIFEVHSSTRMFCPLKDCTFTTKRIQSLREHWQKLHGDLRFPELRQEKGFSYRTNDSSDDEREKVNKKMSVNY